MSEPTGIVAADASGEAVTTDDLLQEEDAIDPTTIPQDTIPNLDDICEDSGEEELPFDVSDFPALAGGKLITNTTTQTNIKAKLKDAGITIALDYLALPAVALLVYIVASYGYSFLFTLPLLPAVLFVEKMKYERKVRQEVRKLRGDFERRSLAGHESLGWINHLLALVWASAKDYISAEFPAIIDAKLAESKPKAIKELKLTNLSIGDFPLRLENFKAYRHNKKQILLDLEVVWDSSMDVSLTAKVAGPPVPLSVSNLYLALAVRIEIDLLQNIYPFAHKATVVLTKPLGLDVKVVPAKVDLTLLPGVQAGIEAALRTTLGNLLQAPNRFEVDILEAMGEDRASLKERIASAEKKQSALASTYGMVTGGVGGVLKGGMKGAGKVASLGVGAIGGGVKGVGNLASFGVSGVKSLGGGAMGFMKKSNSKSSVDGSATKGEGLYPSLQVEDTDPEGATSDAVSPSIKKEKKSGSFVGKLFGSKRKKKAKVPEEGTEM